MTGHSGGLGMTLEYGLNRPKLIIDGVEEFGRRDSVVGLQGYNRVRGYIITNEEAK